MGNKLKMVKNDVIDVVQDKVEQFQKEGELDLPKNYSPENAMKSAWLELQSTKTKSKKPVLQACSKDSIANALLKMVTLGLNPGKKQGYFIAYGKTLTFQPSYFGNVAVVKQTANAKDVNPQVIYKGDELDYEIKNGRTKIKTHKQSFENKVNGKMLGAYAVIEFNDERPDYAEIMTIDQIKNAWKQGQTYKEGGNSPHNNFGEEMAKKTVINRVTKSYINSSNDSHLVSEAINYSNEVETEQEVEQEIEENANSEVIDIQAEEVDEEADQDKQQETEVEQDSQQEDLEPTGTDGPPF